MLHPGHGCSSNVFSTSILGVQTSIQISQRAYDTNIETLCNLEVHNKACAVWWLKINLLHILMCLRSFSRYNFIIVINLFQFASR